MSVEKFVEKLQENDVDEAISSIKTVLKEKLESVLEEKRKFILEGLGFVISEKEEMDDEEDDDEMDDEEDDDEMDDDEGEEKEEKDD